MEEEVKVRVGTPEDVHGCMELALMACRENGISQPNAQKLLADVWPSLHQEFGVVGIIGKPNAMPEGVVLLRIGTLWYSDSPIVEEKAVFVHPQFRDAKAGRAKKLCEFSKKVADELGLPLVIGVVSNRRTRGKIKMYERIFGQPAGAYFLYGGKTGEWEKEAAE